MLTQQHDMWPALRDFNRDTPMAWPVLQRHMLYACVCLALFGLLWLLWLSAARQDWLEAQATHGRLRAEFSAKLLRAAPLAASQRQRSRLEARLELLEKQLVGPHEMALLLADMSRVGRARKLRFELLRPADMGRQLPYAQQHIALRVAGRYQDLAGFAADMAGLHWLVSVQSFTLVPTKDGALLMDASVRTLRPLTMSPSATATKEAP